MGTGQLLARARACLEVLFLTAGAPSGAGESTFSYSLASSAETPAQSDIFVRAAQVDMQGRAALIREALAVHKDAGVHAVSSQRRAAHRNSGVKAWHARWVGAFLSAADRVRNALGNLPRP